MFIMASASRHHGQDGAYRAHQWYIFGISAWISSYCGSCATSCCARIFSLLPLLHLAHSFASSTQWAVINARSAISFNRALFIAHRWHIISRYLAWACCSYSPLCARARLDRTHTRALYRTINACCALSSSAHAGRSDGRAHARHHIAILSMLHSFRAHAHSFYMLRASISTHLCATSARSGTCAIGHHAHARCA